MLIFIGSSGEALPYVRAIQGHLEREPDFEVRAWPEVFVEPLVTTSEYLEVLRSFDFAVFVLTPDDRLNSRGEDFLAPRDNIVYEMGFAVAALGRRRVLPMRPHGQPLKLPSDWAGTDLIRFRAAADSQPSVQEASHGVAAACAQLKDIAQRIGARAEEGQGSDAQGGGVAGAGGPRLFTVSGVVANRGPSASGRRSDDAMSGVVVHLVQMVSAGPGDTTEVAIASTTTDGDGAYRFEGVPRGSYYVQAWSPSNATILRAISQEGAVTNVSPIFELADDDIGSTGFESWPSWDYWGEAALNLGPTHFVHLFTTGTIHGLVRGRGHEPLGEIWLQVTRNPSSSPSPHVQRIRADAEGRYVFSGLLEGVYHVSVWCSELPDLPAVTRERVLRGNNALEQVDFVVDVGGTGGGAV